MMSPRVLLLLVLVALALSICLGVGTGNWGCANYRGFCRAACFPQEISLGPKDCAGEFVYVPIDTALTFVPFLFRPFHKNGEFKTLRLLCVKCFWIRVP